MKKLIFVSCLAVLATAMTAFAADKPVKLSYAGTGFDTSFDSDADGSLVSISQGNVLGTFGNGIIAIEAEWAYGAQPACPAGVLPFGMVSTTVVMTYQDQSQLFGIANGGWMCVNPSNGLYWGNVTGVYPGGTGRFSGVGGTWSTDFGGYTLDVLSGFRSITGKVSGKLEMPKH